MSTRREHVQRFRAILSKQGYADALRYLNQVGSHRFTAVYRFAGGTLENLLLVDRLHPETERGVDGPVLESYCVYVRDTANTFTLEDADRDERVIGHPKRETVKSYCGVPLMSPDGSLFGTICHFDFDAVPFSEDEVFLLEEIGADLVRAVLESRGAAEASAA